ncbi:Thermoresistant gluconokinase [Dyella sp. AD56]|uniref:gluconokinase n=1 Tax=Dyella sp. AD56 TaxID=1528744 RepID=UPI000CB2F9C7|nr:gluconokinase [Dyella sp. AD56]PMQ04989.1 Thermoresistant gluconokinase [Dyella sp. AD56]
MSVALDKSMRAVVVMGFSGCGKTSIATALCAHIQAHMIEGDAFHPEHNIRKMEAGIPLTDADRQGWLETLGRELQRTAQGEDIVVLTCSALKRRYRDTLRAALPGLGFVFLQLSPEEAGRRVAHRTGHFMPASLIDSQFRDLEPPSGESRVVTINATESTDVIVDQIVHWWSTAATTP